jgi:hypothetical protein
MADGAPKPSEIVPTTGRRLALPEGPIFALQRAGQADYEIGAFRAWAGYRDLGSEAATAGLALFQHVISFGSSEESGRTGVHCHLAHVHIVIPTSGRGLFSYDGVVTEAVPGAVIVQHGGTVHDQFAYSYVAATPEQNKQTPVSLDPTPPDAPPQSFGFLELFVPATVADVEIVAPADVTESDQNAAWDHPYHAAGAHYALQAADDLGAIYRPVAGRPDLEARDGDTWAPSGGLVATWIVRPASEPAPAPETVALAIADEVGGLRLLFMARGSATFHRRDGAMFLMSAGDCLTCNADLAGDPIEPSPDMRLLLFFISAAAEQLRQRTPTEIAHLEALGAEIITRREVRPADDRRCINFLHDG